MIGSLMVFGLLLIRIRFFFLGILLMIVGIQFFSMGLIGELMVYFNRKNNHVHQDVEFHNFD